MNIADEVALTEATLHTVARDLIGRWVGALIPDGVSIAVVVVDPLVHGDKVNLVVVAAGNNEQLNERIPQLLCADVEKAKAP